MGGNESKVETEDIQAAVTTAINESMNSCPTSINANQVIVADGCDVSNVNQDMSVSVDTGCVFKSTNVNKMQEDIESNITSSIEQKKSSGLMGSVNDLVNNLFGGEDTENVSKTVKEVVNTYYSKDTSTCSTQIGTNQIVGCGKNSSTGSINNVTQKLDDDTVARCLFNSSNTNDTYTKMAGEINQKLSTDKNTKGITVAVIFILIVLLLLGIGVFKYAQSDNGSKTINRAMMM